MSVETPIAPVDTSPLSSEESSSTPLQFDQREFLRHFARGPFLIEHRLAADPLFDLETLLDLARTLPEDHIEYNAGKVPISIDYQQTPRNGLSPEETIRRIEECQSWLVLKWVERDERYREVLNRCLDQIRPLTETIAPGMSNPQAFVFITSPGSVTPYHIDHEHNFLLQVRGAKTVHMFDGRNREVLSERELEEFYNGGPRNLDFDDAYRNHGWEFDLQAGSGLHFPVTYPHYVANQDAVSVSFSITFRTPDLEKRKYLYGRNARRRLAGAVPRPVGQSPFADSLVYLRHRIAEKLKRMTGRD